MARSQTTNKGTGSAFSRYERAPEGGLGVLKAYSRGPRKANTKCQAQATLSPEECFCLIEAKGLEASGGFGALNPKPCQGATSTRPSQKRLHAHRKLDPETRESLRPESPVRDGPWLNPESSGNSETQLSTLDTFQRWRSSHLRG